MGAAKLSSWAGGIDNVSPSDRIPEGYVRDMANFDPLPGGSLGLRTGAKQLLACDECRGAFIVGRYLLIADGGNLSALHLDTEMVDTLTSDLPPGLLAGCEANGQLYLSTPTGLYRTDGTTLRRWDVPAPAFTATQLAGGSMSGQYKVAVTAVGEDGEESGAVPVVVTLAGGKLQVRSDDPRPLRLYVSPANAASLYYQGTMVGGVALIEAPADDRARFTTAHLEPMPPAEQLVSHHGVLVGSVGRFVFLSEPMYPHLTNPATRFFQFGSDVRALAPTDGGIFVLLENHAYFIAGVETEQPTQRQVDNIGALYGSALALPDGNAAWFGRHGLVIGAPDGSTAMPSRAHHAPMLADRASCGILEHMGSVRVVVCLGGQLRANPRARAADDGPDLTYAVSLETGAVTRYTDFSFAGFADCDGASFAWRADGVYRLGVPVDVSTPINARLDLPATDFGTSASKRLQTAWLVLDTDGQAALQVGVDGGQAVEHPALETTGTCKVLLARGLFGRRWDVSLELLWASRAELVSLEIEVGAAQRRIK